MMEKHKGLLCALALALFAGPAGAQITPFSQDVMDSIDLGLDWLDNPTATGMGLDAFEGGCQEYGFERGDATGLVTLAVLEKRADANPNTISQGWAGANLVDQGRISRGINVLLNRGPDNFIAYRDGADLMALSVYQQTGGPLQAAALNRIRVLVDRINSNQHPNGYWGYWSGDLANDDSSTTQFASAGLVAARGVLFGSAPDAARLLLLNQNLTNTQAAYVANGLPGLDGIADVQPGELGHGYTRGDTHNTRQQTASGLWAQLAGASVDNPATININNAGIQGYMHWLQNRYRYTDATAPWGTELTRYYYFWSFSKGMGFIEDQGIAALGGNLDPLAMGTLIDDDLGPLHREHQRDPSTEPRALVGFRGAPNYYNNVALTAHWYFDIAYTILMDQQANGRFAPPESHDDCSSQAYAILVLERSLGGACIDTDGDEICDPVDNCVNTPNPNQEDADNNGIGDACEASTVCCLICEVAVMTSAGQCELSGGEVTDYELCCPTVCCELPDGTRGVIHSEDCVPEGGIALPAVQCEAEPDVCCELPDGSVATIPADQCHQQGGQQAADEICEDVCCQLEGDVVLTLPLGECNHRGGAITDPLICEELICCQLANGVSTVTREACAQALGFVTDEFLCEDVCCLIDNNNTSVIPRDDCFQQGGQDLPVEQCEEVCCATEQGHINGPLALCEANGGAPDNPELCNAEVCCFIPNTGTFETMSESDCIRTYFDQVGGMGPGGVQPIEWCEAEEICCEIPGQAPSTIPPAECLLQGGFVPPDPNACEAVCCDLPNSPFITLSLGECIDHGGIAANNLSCEETCCLLDGNNVNMLVGDCEELGGSSLPLPWCEGALVCCEYPNQGTNTVPPAICEDGGGIVLGGPEQCEEVCCIMPDGTPATLSLRECEVAGGQPNPVDTCEETCCGLPDGSNVNMSIANCQMQGGALQPLEVCNQQVICCVHDQIAEYIPQGACIANGWAVSSDEPSPCEEVCCTMEDGSTATISLHECENSGGQPNPVEVCEEVCCTSEGQTQITSLWECDLHGGQANPSEECTVCCQQADGSVAIDARCEPQNIVESEACEPVCCQDEQTGAVSTTLAGNCKNGSVVPPELCEEICCEGPGFAGLMSQAMCDSRGGVNNPNACLPAANANAFICCQAPGEQAHLVEAQACRDIEVPLALCAEQPMRAGAQPLNTNNKSQSDGGCAMSQDSSTPAWFWALLLLPAIRRRRRQH